MHDKITQVILSESLTPQNIENLSSTLRTVLGHSGGILYRDGQFTLQGPQGEEAQTIPLLQAIQLQSAAKGAGRGDIETGAKVIHTIFGGSGESSSQ